MSSTRAQDVARGDAAPSVVRESPRFGYVWTLPHNWEFVQPAKEWRVPAGSALDAVAAEQRGHDGPVALALVIDLVSIVPGRVWGRDPKDYDGLEDYGGKQLRQAGATVTGTRRVTMLGLAAVQVLGAKGSDRIAIRILYRGHRRFEFRCRSRAEKSEWPCEPAFAGFRIADLREESTESDTPHVFRLRDARFGIAFDPPDDSWLAIGPRTGAGGAQQVWIWNKEGRQIDVQAFDLAAIPSRLDEAALVSMMAERYRREGAVVEESEATLGGERCHHLELNRTHGNQQDFFIIVRQGINYSLLVTQQTRDQSLIARALKGFRFTPK
jgi:hypothetical protein